MSGKRTGGWMVGDVSSSSLADDIVSGAEDAVLKRVDGSWSTGRVKGKLLKDIAEGVETAVRCPEAGEGLLTVLLRR